MSERKYSVSEIGRMRVLVRDLCTPIGVAYNPTELTAKIEAQLQTYMLNGTDPEELERAVSEQMSARMARQERFGSGIVWVSS